MTQDRDIAYERGGETFRGTWHVENGYVLVSSAFGSKTSPVAGYAKIPDVVAKVMLAEIVNDWIIQGRSQ